MDQPARRSTPARTALATMLVALLFGSVTVATPAPATHPRGTSAKVELFARRLRRYAKAAKELLGEMDRTRFDPAAVVKQVGRDPQDLRRYVRDDTTPLRYAGALRGPRGVLMERRGNSVDRCLLLAKLLQIAGHDQLRLCHARIPIKATTGKRKRSAPRTSPSRANEKRVAAHVAKLLGIGKDEATASVLGARVAEETRRENVLQQTLVQSRELVQLLGFQRNVPNHSSRDRRGRRFADHWWVELKEKGGWTPLDPSTKDGVPPKSTTKPKTCGPEQLPDEVYQTVTISVLATKREGGNVTTAPVLVHRFRAADLAGEVLGLSLAPIPIAGKPKFLDDPKHVRAKAVKFLRAQSEWLPSIRIDGRKTIKQWSVTDRGTVNHHPNITASSRKLSKAASALGGMGAKKGSGELTGISLRFRIDVPGRPPEIVDRSLFDLTDAGTGKGHLTEEQKIRRAVALTGSMQVLIVPSRISAEYVLDRQLRTFLKNRLTLLEWGYSVSRLNMKRTFSSLTKLAYFPSRLLGLAMARRAWGVEDGLYLGRVNLIAEFSGLSYRKGSITADRGFDILSNPVDVERGGSRNPRLARLTQGVLDTVAERLFTQSQDVNTVAAFGKAIAAGRAWHVVKDPKDLSSAASRFPAAARAAMRRELKDGSWVVLPDHPVKLGGRPRAVWWRVNPSTGRTLGMAGAGRGQEILEETATMLAGMYGVLKALNGVMECVNPNMSPEEVACCTRRLAISGLGGAGYGMVLEKLEVSAIACITSELVMDRATEAANEIAPCEK